ncbi:LTA synthase family protein [Dokdonella koreensis]|nr:LTA synthase family protein [Dokdonella koreensis]
MNILLALRQSPAGRTPMRLVLALVLCAGLLMGVVDRLDPAFAARAASAGGNLGLLALNTLPAVALLLALWALTRRLLLACWLTLLAIAGLYAANAAKIEHLQTPLLPADLRFFSEPGPALELFGHYVSFEMRHLLPAAAVILFTLLLWNRPGLPGLAGWRRLALGAVAVVATVTMVAGSGPWKRVFDARRLGFEPWALAESTTHVGLIGALLMYHWELGGGDVPRADREAALALLHDHGPALRARLAATAAGEPAPDIVVVQSESLFDPARLRDIPSGQYLREYHRLRKRAKAGEMTVPTFGGGTIRTEFEVLTGVPLDTLGGLQYPWLELHRHDLPNLASVLSRQGYRTTAIHPNSAAFWNRSKAYPALGFDRFLDIGAFSKEDVVGLFTSDAALTDRILAELDTGGQPHFIFAISMENHGPFDWRPGLDAERLSRLSMPERLDEGGRYWLGNYLYLLEDADRELGRLIGALKKRERRTLVLFYGDHLPALPPVYHQLGFEDERDAQLQTVPWLLYDSARTRPQRFNTRSWLLPSLLLDAAGVHDEPYFAVIDTLRSQIDLDDRELDGTEQAGLLALARLQLRGELPSLLDEALAAEPAAQDEQALAP